MSPATARTLATLTLTALLLSPAAAQESPLAPILDAAADLPQLRTVTVSLDGEIIADRGYNGFSSADPANIKSASKVIVAAMVGIAIDKGLIESVDQPVAELLPNRLPENPDPRLFDITLSHLLSMQAGLEATSGVNYGAWVASDDWVASALAMPFAAEPGGDMIYSTGSTHLLSAILTEVGGASTLELAREWFAPIEGFAIADWQQDPQGVYLGGNEMAMTPLSLLAFGETIRNQGRAPDGAPTIPAEWIEISFEPRTTSRFTHGSYGYAWFLDEIGGLVVAYAWGYGGQMLYIVPDAALTVVITSDPASPSEDTGYRERLNTLLADIIEAVD